MINVSKAFPSDDAARREFLRIARTGLVREGNYLTGQVVTVARRGNSIAAQSDALSTVDGVLDELRIPPNRREGWK